MFILLGGLVCSVRTFCDSWKPPGFACTHLLFLSDLLFKFTINIYLRYFYFVLKGLSNKRYSIKLLYTIFLSRSFPLVNYNCVQCTGLWFFPLVRYFPTCLMFAIIFLFQMDAYYYTTFLECEKVLLGNFAHFCMWAITVLLLFLWFFHHLFSLRSLSQGKWSWGIWDLLFSLCKPFVCILFNTRLCLASTVICIFMCR